MSFITIPKFKIDSLQSLFELPELLNSDRWVFRGQVNSKWNLSTTFERLCNKNNVPFDLRYLLEKKMIEKFQSEASTILEEPPEENDLLKWVSLIQHYGGATRLLDFTYSFYIALFFALNDSEQNSAIWCVNYWPLIDRLRREAEYSSTFRDRKKNFSYLELRNLLNEYCENSFTRILDDPWCLPSILILDPFRKSYPEAKKSEYHFDNQFSLFSDPPGGKIKTPKILNERIKSQRGLFVFPLNINHTFQENIVGHLKNLASQELQNSDFNNIREKEKNLVEISHLDLMNNPIIKIEIDKNLKSKSLDMLESMNITYSSLFPDLVGIAQSLNYSFSELVNSNIGNE